MALAREHDTTTFSVLHAAFTVLLSRLSGASDVAIGTTTVVDDGRSRNLVVLRNRVEPDTSFTHLLGHVRDVDQAAFEHRDVPFEQVVRTLALSDSPAYSPIVQVLFECREGAETSGLGRFDLRVTAAEAVDADGIPSGITATLGFATDLFDPTTVRGLGERFRRILQTVTGDPALAVGDIDILSDTEHATLVPVSGVPGRPGRTLPELFSAAARTNPTGVALSYRGVEVTYQELTSARTSWHASSPNAASGRRTSWHWA